MVCEEFARNQTQYGIEKWAMGCHGELGLASPLRANSLCVPVFRDGAS